MYLVGDWMTKGPVTLRESDDLATAAALFKLGRVRHLPVVRGDKLVGLVTQRDLLRAVGSKRRSEEHAQPVKQLMRKGLVTARPTTPLREVAQAMLKKKIGCVPVIGVGRKLLGIVTEADLVRLAAQVLDDVDRMDALVGEVTGSARRKRR